MCDNILFGRITGAISVGSQTNSGYLTVDPTARVIDRAGTGSVLSNPNLIPSDHHGVRRAKVGVVSLFSKMNPVT